MLIRDKNLGPNNNFVGKITATATTLTFAAGALTNETVAAPTGRNLSRLRLSSVGYEFASGATSMAYNSTTKMFTLTRATGSLDWTTLGLNPGETIFIGGDDVAYRFADNGNHKAPNGFARIRTISASSIVFDDVTFTKPTADVTFAGTGKTIQIFWGQFLHNGNTKRTFTIERILGRKSSDQTKAMADYVVGAMPNEMTINP